MRPASLGGPNGRISPPPRFPGFGAVFCERGTAIYANMVSINVRHGEPGFIWRLARLQLAFVPAFVELLRQCFYIGIGMIRRQTIAALHFALHFASQIALHFALHIALILRGKSSRQKAAVLQTKALFGERPRVVSVLAKCQARLRTVKPGRLRRALSASLRSGAWTMRSQHG